jgi:mycothiol synthase
MVVRQLFMRLPDFEHLPPMPPVPPGYERRMAVAADAEGIAATMASAFAPDWTVERVQSALLDAEDVPKTFLITFQGLPVATASARLVPDQYPGSGYVHWVAVHADHRGKRLGYIVSLEVLRYFRSIGCRDAVLETDPPRLAAIRTYLNLGFVPENVDPEHEAHWRDIRQTLGVGPST